MKAAITPVIAFNPGARTIDFAAYADFDVRLLYAVINATRSKIIFAQGVVGLGYSTITGTVLTLQADTTTHNAADVLMALYDLASQPVTVPPLLYTGGAVATIGVTTGLLVAAGQYKRALVITSLPGSTNPAWLRADGQNAVIRTGILLAPNGGSVVFGNSAFPIPTANIMAITEGASSVNVALAGG